MHTAEAVVTPLFTVNQEVGRALLERHEALVRRQEVRYMPGAGFGSSANAICAGTHF